MSSDPIWMKILIQYIHSGNIFHNSHTFDLVFNFSYFRISSTISSMKLTTSSLDKGNESPLILYPSE